MPADHASTPKRNFWEQMASGLGYHLDNFGRWLIVRAPAVGAAYASFLAPRPPQLRRGPGWRFAQEYYEQRQWLACRRGALWEAARESQAKVTLTLPWHGCTALQVTLGNDNSLCLYVCGSFEPNEFAFLDQILKPGMVFVDVGANDGFYTVFAASRVGSNGLVVAIEPSTRERVKLKKNLSYNGLTNVRVVPAALGAAEGEAELKLAQDVHSGHNTLGAFAHADVLPASREQIAVDRLDAVVERLNLPRVDFVKIDVEGSEARVLAGAEHVLAAMRPLLLLEINDGALKAQGTSANAILARLRTGFGYEIMNFSPVTGIVSPAGDKDPLSENIVAVPKERISEMVR